MKLTKEENIWLRMWVGCYECPETVTCKEEKPCKECKIFNKVYAKIVEAQK